MQLKQSLGYLDNMMKCVDAAIAVNFDSLNVSVNVSADQFISSLNTLMLGLSQDIVNVNFELYIEFITFYFEGEISDYQLESLLRYCSIMDHATVFMIYSPQVAQIYNFP